jgi:hypothetical protein
MRSFGSCGTIQDATTGAGPHSSPSVFPCEEWETTEARELRTEVANRELRIRSKQSTRYSKIRTRSATGRLRTWAVLSFMHACLHGFGQLFLVVRKKCFDFVVCLVADRMDLRAESFVRSRRIFIEERLNLLVMFKQQRSDLLLLCGGEFEFVCQVVEFLVDSAVRMESLNLCRRVIRAYGSADRTEHNKAAKHKGEKYISHGSSILRFC